MEFISDRFEILELINLIETPETELPKIAQSWWKVTMSFLQKVYLKKLHTKEIKLQKKNLLVGLP